MVTLRFKITGDKITFKHFRLVDGKVCYDNGKPVDMTNWTLVKSSKDLKQ